MPEAGQHATAVIQFEECEQNVLGSDVVVTEPQGLPEGELQGLPGAGVVGNERRVPSSVAGGKVAVTASRTVSNCTPCATIACAPSANGLGQQAE